MHDDFINFLVNSGIYGKLNFTEDNLKLLFQLLLAEYSIDAYCTRCNSSSIFIKKPLNDDIAYRIKVVRQNIDNANRSIPGPGPEFLLEQLISLQSIGIFPLTFSCSRDNFTLTIFIKIINKTIIKVGQDPSPIDITSKIPPKYSQILGLSFKEYKNAIELHAHGYHVGAYAYLRRIVENLTEEAHQKAIFNNTWNEELYKTERFSEKIKLLKEYLPEFFTTNVTIYGLISKGIHELSEPDCENMFPVLKAAIDYTLDEIIELKQKQTKKLETEKSLSKLASIYGNNK